MYANRDTAVPVVPVVPLSGAQRGGLAGIPLLAVCCLLFLLFLIAATIVLALIPVYLQAKNVQQGGRSQTFFGRSDFSGATVSDGSVGSSGLTAIGNGIASSVGASPGAVTVPSATFATTGGTGGKRKRRGLALRSRRFNTATGGIQFLFFTFFFNFAFCPIRGKCAKPATTIIVTSITFIYQNVVITITLIITVFTSAIAVPPTQAALTTTTASTASTSTASTVATTTGLLNG